MICRTSSTCIVLCAVLLSSLSSQCHAFTVSSQTKVTSRQQQRSLPVLAAESKDEKAVAVKSTLGKEITYDQESGRFFEKDGECIPDEEYCVLDKDSGEMIRLTLEEKERIFMDSLQVRWVLFWCCCDALFVSSLVVDLSDRRKIHINMASFLSSLFHPNTNTQSYYTSGRQLLSDGEFDLLKEDLQWSGSDLVQMSAKEVKYMTAMQEYLKGSPVMPDKEFDNLKNELKEEGSKFAVQTEPKCYIDTGICKVTLQEDQFRSNLLYLPAGLALMTLWLFFGFELIEPIIRLNPVFLAILGLPWVITGSKGITENFIFTDFKIAYGPCPSCNFENRIYFGDILGVEGFKDLANVKCPNCKTTFSVQRSSLRASTLPK